MAFMGTGGKSSDNIARAFYTDTDGVLATYNKPSVRTLINEDRTIPAGGVIEYFVNEMGINFTVSGVVSNGVNTVVLGVKDTVNQQSEMVTYDSVTVNSNLFVSDIYTTKTGSVRVRIQNRDTFDIVISKLYITSAYYEPQRFNTDEDENIIVTTNKSELVIDQTLKASAAGFHVVGATSGRSHRVILDVSKFKNIIIKLDNIGTINPGFARILLFSENGRSTTGNLPHNDSAYLSDVTRVIANGSVILTSDEYHALDQPIVGLQVFYESVPVGAEFRCRIIGGY